MKRLATALVCAVSVAALMVPDFAAAQTQPERRAARSAQQTQTRQTTRTRQVRRARPVTQRTRTVRTTQRTRVVTQRPARTTVRSTRTVTRNVYRIGHRPSTFRRIRATTFRYPRGFRYRRFRTGSILPRLFLSSLYFFNDYSLLGLGPPPRGYVWVRYGPDLLLVNRYNGRIVDVIYGAFY